MASRSWNRVELIGNLTRDPELRYTPNGAAVCTFGLATNRTFVTEGEKREEVDFHRLVAWNKLAELCSQLLKKGTKVFISGRLQNRSWEGADGAQRQTTEIVIEDMILLTPKGNGIEASSGENIDIDSLPVSEPKKEIVANTSEESPPVPPSEVSAEAAEEEPEIEKPKEEVGDKDLPF